MGKNVHMLPPDTRDSIKIIQKLIKAVGIIEKECFHVHALAAGADALQAQGGREMYIRMLRYHVSHEGAMIFPDALTKAALVAAENALVQKLMEEEAAKNAAH